jgi:hypothetical protein
MAVDAAYIKNLFPEFSSVDAARIAAFIGIAQVSMNAGVWGTAYDAGLAYLTAHLLKKSGPGGGVQGGNSTAGPLTQERVGELSRSYGSVDLGSMSQGDALLASTAYGIEYLRLRKLIPTTPMVT